MPFVAEVKYFNSFWLKQVVDDSTADPFPDGKPFWPGGYPYNNTAATQISAAVGPFPTSARASGPIVSKTEDYYVEEARIRGGYNNLTVDFGVKAYLVEDNPNSQWRFNSLIYSGVFNSRTGVNYTNQFPSGTNITRSLDPVNASIQKLYAEDTNLIIFQENKVSNALIDKDAIYTAEGQAITTTGANVIGQVRAYAGQYGISKNPESFAVYGYQKYFSDKNRNAVLRLSQDGITEISNYGMYDFFRDQLTLLPNEVDFIIHTIGNKSEGIATVTADVVASATIVVTNVQGEILPGADVDPSIPGVPLATTVVSYDNATQTVVLSAAVTVNADSIIRFNTGGYGVSSSLELKVSKASGSLKSILKGFTVLGFGPDLYIEDITPNVMGDLTLRLNRPVTIQYDTSVSFMTPFSGYITGGYDYYAKNYTMSFQPQPNWLDTPPFITTPYSTLSYDEMSKGWTSFYTYKPSWIFSLRGMYYTIFKGSIYAHYSTPLRNLFYFSTIKSSITFVFNPNPTTQKVFQTIDYEGSNGWEVQTLYSDTTGVIPVYDEQGNSNDYVKTDRAYKIRSYTEGAYTNTAAYPAALTGTIFRSGFDLKENKYVANIKSSNPVGSGEVIGGIDTSGIKGYTATAIFTQDSNTIGKEIELFSVGATYTRSNGY